MSSPLKPQPGLSIAFIGGGPRMTGVLERLASNLQEFPVERFTVHIFDPFDPGSGRIWRREQSGLLKLNSTAADVTMFTDSSVQIDGPISPGPSLIDWATAIRSGVITDVVLKSEELRAEVATLLPGSFPSRRLQSEYLQWCYRRAARRLAPWAEIKHHRRLVDQLDAIAGGRQRIHSGPQQQPILVDAVVLALGHTDALPDQPTRQLLDFASRQGAWYLPPCYTADADLSAVRPGQDVLVRGMGLAFIDLMVLLMEGRGGRFEELPEGGLRYLPSGQEPRLHVGSRRGVPYHSKTRTELQGEPYTPSYFTAAVTAELLERYPTLDFETQLWPLVAKELLHGYYRELATGHPERVRGDWSDFRQLFDQPGLPAKQALQALLVDSQDYLDLAALDRPFTDAQPADLQGWLRSYLEEDLRRRTSERHSETFGLFLALLNCYGTLSQIPRQRLDLQPGLRERWHGFFSFIASGPPPQRLRELLALHDAGLITFLGAGLSITADEQSGNFQASSAVLPEPIRAKALIDAFLPRQTAAYSANPLISGGGFAERVTVDSQLRILDRDGIPAARRFALGAFTDSAAGGAFVRPGSNAPSFRENDALARDLLRLLNDTAQIAESEKDHELQRLSA
ncbi:hypothetical protein FHU41_000389 [Psychromicrobium silvestre]|uniref:FAD-dependent urate hydroxylase HpyO/Asp monooxygenase CreE-like FAD/NAD(P)-binding domain-containing protein n=1 Tax=Psychromicrobium silvestre TaxID=1645614 RepID=A0A7Y9LRC5_9MICC|nr:FAD/NAD(P)-binding protein [Psychromicrobium silvestre]NYE94168.1 hypothetical protein [Psychromicrobium silvestre]